MGAGRYAQTNWTSPLLDMVGDIGTNQQHPTTHPHRREHWGFAELPAKRQGSLLAGIDCECSEISP